MKRNSLSGVGQVFKFTFRQTCTTKAWLISTFLILCFLIIGIPLLLLSIASTSEDPDGEAEQQKRIGQVVVCDETPGTVDYTQLTTFGSYPETVYQSVATMDDAIAAATADNALILHITKEDADFLLTVLLPDETALSRSEASSFGDYVRNCFPAFLIQKANLDPSVGVLLSLPIGTEVEQLTADAEPLEETNFVMQILKTVFPFLMIMLMYMMTLLYGQSIGNSVLMEKTSMLMDTMLTSVHPFALILGKLFAIACSAFLQIFIWLCGLIGGCVGGVLLAMRAVPDTPDTTIQTMNSVIEGREIFSLSGILVSLLVIALGFFLYCALAAISGALASKAEDLAKTNYVFVLVLIASFFLCLSSPDMNNAEMISTAAWLNYFPFTAILVVPGQVLLGTIPVYQGLLSALILLVTVVLLTRLSAGIYQMLVMYRGNPPTPKALFEMIRASIQRKKGGKMND